MGLVQIDQKSDVAVQFNDQTIRANSQVITVNFPKNHGGFIINRPHSVTVSGADGQEKTLRVMDVTRRAQILLIVLGIIGAIIIQSWRKND